MKRSCKSLVAFLGAWIVAVTAGFLISRSSVFAAGGNAPPPCNTCVYCEEWDTYFKAATNTVAGTSTPLPLSEPANEAWDGTLSGGGDLHQSEVCNSAGETGPEDNNAPLILTHYDSADPTCSATVFPLTGIYKSENGVNPQPVGGIFGQSICINTD